VVELQPNEEVYTESNSSRQTEGIFQCGGIYYIRTRHRRRQPMALLCMKTRSCQLEKVSVIEMGIYMHDNELKDAILAEGRDSRTYGEPMW
jgi:hypothetical protein